MPCWTRNKIARNFVYGIATLYKITVDDKFLSYFDRKLERKYGGLLKSTTHEIAEEKFLKEIGDENLKSELERWIKIVISDYKSSAEKGLTEEIYGIKKEKRRWRLARKKREENEMPAEARAIYN
ncbi:hypothetical protein EPN87_01640 [archaeon]|nr:MAG: hypothetical protein EPN87_01640 [archaeon]